LLPFSKRNQLIISSIALFTWVVSMSIYQWPEFCNGCFGGVEMCAREGSGDPWRTGTWILWHCKSVSQFIFLLMNHHTTKTIWAQSQWNRCACVPGLLLHLNYWLQIASGPATRIKAIGQSTMSLCPSLCLSVCLYLHLFMALSQSFSRTVVVYMDNQSICTCMQT